MTLRRGHVVLALLVGGGVALAGASQTWVESVAGASRDSPTTNVAVQAVVTGSQAAPLVTAAALVVLAAAGALALSGRVTRLVALVLALLGGVAVAVPTMTVLSSPDEAAAEAMAENSGVVGGFDVEGIDVTTTAWPVVVVAGAGVVLVAALVGLARARRWDTVTRFEALATVRSDDASASVSAAPGAEQHPGDDWDALTRDEDPTQERPSSEHRPPA